MAIAFVYLVLRILLMERSARPRRSLLEFGLITAPSLGLLPIYLALLGGVLHNEATKTSSQHVTLANFQPSLDNYLKDNVAFWHLVLIIALLTPIILLIRRNHPLATAATATLVPAIALILTLREIRFVFVLPIAIAIGLGAWWTLTINSRRQVASSFDRVLVATMALVLLVESALGIATFHQQVQWYSSLTPSTVTALEQLDRLAPRGAVLAVSPAAAHEDGWPLGRWVEGLLDRPTYYASDLEWLNYPDERRRASIANEMFSPSQGVSGAVTMARAIGISYIIVATGWPGYRQWVSSSPSLEGATVVIQSDSMLILATSG